jgi:hypothetical protein
VDKALDVATDILTSATEAVAHRNYRCTRCQAPVLLRLGEINKRHFAHAVGLADPDCEHYFPTTITYTGRRMGPARADSQTSTQQYGDLFFDMSASGPQLSIWFPPTHDTVWSGQVVVEAPRLSRSLKASHLERGQRVTFDLDTAQWTVSIQGDVPDYYQGRIEVGHNTLESGLNLFDATHSPGRRLGPSDVVRLGDAVWLITRTEVPLDSAVRRVAHCALKTESGGWYVYLVELPDECAREDVASLSLSLQRRVRFGRARVWIEKPWPWMRGTDGAAVYSATHGSLEFASSTPVDMEIESTSDETVVVRGARVTRLSWLEPLVGDWHVFVNGTRYDTIRISAQPPFNPPTVLVDFGGLIRCDISEAQQCFDRLARDRSQPAWVRLRWLHERVGRFVRINGRRVDDPAAGTYEMSLSGNVTISVGALGSFALAPGLSPREPNNIAGLYARAAWLLSLPRAGSPQPSCTLKVPRVLMKDPLFLRLESVAWPLFLKPQVAALERALGDLQ